MPILPVIRLLCEFIIVCVLLISHFFTLSFVLQFLFLVLQVWVQAISFIAYILLAKNYCVVERHGIRGGFFRMCCVYLKLCTRCALACALQHSKSGLGMKYCYICLSPTLFVVYNPYNTHGSALSSTHAHTHTTHTWKKHFKQRTPMHNGFSHIYIEEKFYVHIQNYSYRRNFMHTYIYIKTQQCVVRPKKPTHHTREYIDRKNNNAIFASM